MELGLKRKVALVSAASQGLGRAAAFAFAREGCKVAICARSAGALEDAAKAMREETNAEVIAVAADVSRADGVILSMAVRQPIDNLVLSNSLRLGVVGALKTLAREVAKDRIRVNGVAPGWIATDRTVQLHRARAEKERRRIEDVQAAVLQEIPMGRMGTPEEVADLIAFLASDRAAYITGVIAQIDGGLYRGIF